MTQPRKEKKPQARKPTSRKPAKSDATQPVGVRQDGREDGQRNPRAV